MAADRRRFSNALAAKPPSRQMGATLEDIAPGVAAPVAYLPFSGWKESFFGDLHAQGRDAVDFYTEKKVVIERWPDGWSRAF